jgi:hypothetical protein
LKASFTIAPLLIHANFSKPFVLEVDIFDFIVGIILSQFGKDNFFHPIDFHNHNYFPIKINYKIYDKELLTIVDAFQECCHLFVEVQHEITVYLDHKDFSC